MKPKILLAALVVGTVCLVIGLAAWLATRPPKFSLANIDSKIVRLSKPGTTVKEVVRGGSVSRSDIFGVMTPMSIKENASLTIHPIFMSFGIHKA